MYMDKEILDRVITARQIIGQILDDEVKDVPDRLTMLATAWHELNAILGYDGQ